MSSDFFRKKNETLAQKVFELSYNALVLGFLVIVAGWWLENRLAVYDQRKAFVFFQNEQVEKTFKLLTSAFSKPLICLLKPENVVNSNCKKHLDPFSQAIEEKKRIISSIDPNLNLKYLDAVIKAIRELDDKSQSRGSEAASVNKKLVDDYRTALTTAIRNIAKEYK